MALPLKCVNWCNNWLRSAKNPSHPVEQTAPKWTWASWMAERRLQVCRRQDRFLVALRALPTYQNNTMTSFGGKNPSGSLQPNAFLDRMHRLAPRKNYSADTRRSPGDTFVVPRDLFTRRRRRRRAPFFALSGGRTDPQGKNRAR